jgi:hypothetical protein
LFPDIPKEQLDDALQSSAGDVELAIAQLLSIDRHPEANLAAVMANSVSPKSEDKLDDGDEKLAALATMFPDVDPDVLISRLISSNWQLSESIDAVLAQLAAEDELSIDNSRTNGRRRTQRSARRQIIHHFSAMAAITHRPQPAVSSSAGMNGGAVLDLSVGSPSLSVRTSSSVPTAPTQSSEQLRAQAQQLHQERSELYQKASEAYRRSSSTIQRQVASYYAQEV